MALAIYKSGQGYWTRVLTAVGVGILVLAAALWMVQELSVVGTSAGLTFTYAELASGVHTWAGGANHPAAALTSIRDFKTDHPAAQGPPNQIVLTDRNTGQEYTLTREQFAAAIDAAQRNVAAAHKGSPVVHVTGEDVRSAVVKDNNIVVSVATFAARNRLYIQSGVATLLLVSMGVLTYYLLNQPRVADFMIATEAEMRKVSWPDRKETIGSTWVVICGTFMMAALLLLIDVAFSWFFIKIHVLQGG